MYLEIAPTKPKINTIKLPISSSGELTSCLYAGQVSTAEKERTVPVSLEDWEKLSIKTKEIKNKLSSAASSAVSA